MITRRLKSQIVPVPELDEETARQLFEIFSRHFEQVTWPRFLSDLKEKDFVLILQDAATGEPRGFSAQQILTAQVGEVPVRAIFSGDTIIDRPFWGEQELVRGWCRFAGQVLAEEPDTRLYWFLISKGYRTYLFLPIFYREFFPRHDVQTPAFEQTVIDALALKKYPGHYSTTSGLIEFPVSHGHLTPELAEVPRRRRSHPHVNYFLKLNPNYSRGTELVCLAEISQSNMRSIAAVAMSEGMKHGALRESSVASHA